MSRTTAFARSSYEPKPPCRLFGPARRDGLDDLEPAHRADRFTAYAARRVECPQPLAAIEWAHIRRCADEPLAASGSELRVGRGRPSGGSRTRRGRMGLRAVRGAPRGWAPQTAA